MDLNRSTIYTINDLAGYTNIVKFHIGDDIYLKKDNIKITLYDDSLYITDIKNALIKGKTCNQYSIQTNTNNTTDNSDLIYKFLKQFDFNITKVIKHLNSIVEFKHSTYCNKTIDNLVIYKTVLKSSRVFSPFNLEHIKPLKKLPNKFNLTTAIRIIINHQYQNFKCNGIYTDDYANDSQVNFHKGNIENRLSFAKELIEDPSGWWVSLNNELLELKICCHHFDSNSLIVDINNKIEPLKISIARNIKTNGFEIKFPYRIDKKTFQGLINKGFKLNKAKIWVASYTKLREQYIKSLIK